MGIQTSIPVENSDPNKNNSEGLKKIEFSQNWNGKLRTNVFSTIRPNSNKYIIGEKYAIYLEERFYCYAKIIHTETLTLQEITKRKYHLLDTGKNEQYFMDLLANFYDKKSWWKGKETKMSFVLIEKIEQLDLFDQIV